MTDDEAGRVRALVELGELSWKLWRLRFPRGARGLPNGGGGAATLGYAGGWPAPWRAMARQAAEHLRAVQGRLSDLAAVSIDADRPGPLSGALDTIAAAATALEPPKYDAQVTATTRIRVERAVRDVITALAPLRGWTLAAVEDAQVLDDGGTVQHVEYVDYTGPNVRGCRQHVSVIGLRQLPRFVYLTRWEDRLAIALEPYVRALAPNGAAMASSSLQPPRFSPQECTAIEPFEAGAKWSFP